MHHHNSNEVTKCFLRIDEPITFYLHAWQQQSGKCVKLTGGNRCEKVPELINQLHDALMLQDETKLAKDFIVEYKKLWRLIKTATKAKIDLENINDLTKLCGKKISICIGGTAREMSPGKFGIISFEFRYNKPAMKRSVREPPTSCPWSPEKSQLMRDWQIYLNNHGIS